MEKIETMSIDLETFSSVDIGKRSVYKYAESTDFEILLFGVSINSGDVVVYDIASGDQLPKDILRALTDPAVRKWAFHANFERVCISVWLQRVHPDYFVGYSAPDDPCSKYLNPEGWYCSMVWSAYMGLPMSLAGAGAVLGFEKQKMTEGKDLIAYFCKPCRPTKTNGGRTRNLPSHAPEKWAAFKAYNKRDVEVEMQIQRRLHKFPVPDSVWEEYWIDQQINDRGVRIDRKLVGNAISIDSQTREKLLGRMKEITHLENPNSVVQMLDWLESHGVDVNSLDKKHVEELRKAADGEVKEVLRLRQMTAKSSVKKYQAMENAACSDDRIRGMFMFYGASRSGRFAGRIVQLQNLVRNSIPDLEQARDLVRNGDIESLDMLYDNIPQVLSELIRTALEPREGMKFVVADYSSIEARALAYLSGEQHTIDSFARGEDLYCATASAMFGVPVVKHGINGELRQKGKIATLACGYGGSVGALKAMGALDMGLKEEELQPIVDSWRAANPHIVRFWYDADEAVRTVIKGHCSVETHGIRFVYRSGMLFVELPSGRHLSYVKPQIGENRFGGESITYLGLDSTKHWNRIESFGGKIVENITQAICRDILCYAMRTLRDCNIVAHIHDELVIECGKDVAVDVICKQMGRTPPWVPGLLLRADGYECNFYMKD